MGYLTFEILVFLLLAALLGFVIGWLLRSSHFQSEIQDLDGRWRAKLADVEGERDQFASELTTAKEARAKVEASAAEAKRLAETHESSLQQLRREHDTKLGLIGDFEKRVGSLEGDLSNREQELTTAKEALARQGDAGGDAAHLNKELAAATDRAQALERELREARDANSTCRKRVETLEAQLASAQRDSATQGGALGLVSSPDSSTTGRTDRAGGGGTSTGGAVGGSAGSAGGTSETAGGTGSGTGSAGGSGDSSTRSPGGMGDTAGTAGGTGSGTGSAGGPSDSSTGSSGGMGGATSGTAGGATGGGSFGNGGTGATGGGALGLVGGTDMRAGQSGREDDEEGVRPEALDGPRGGVADDLKKISGVGPKLEKTLNGLGIYHFSQIAEFTPAHVTWVDKYLRFKGRIDRENWIEQAKILAAGGETDFSRRN